MSRWYVIGMEIPKRKNGSEKDPWINLYLVSTRPAGLGRDMDFMAGRTCKVVSCHRSWWNQCPKPAEYDFDWEVRDGRDGAYEVLAGIEYVADLPEEIQPWLLLGAGGEPPRLKRA